MSYPRNLDDYNDQELIDELQKRHVKRIQGECAYCDRPTKKCTCRKKEYEQERLKLAQSYSGQRRNPIPFGGY